MMHINTSVSADCQQRALTDLAPATRKQRAEVPWPSLAGAHNNKMSRPTADKEMFTPFIQEISSIFKHLFSLNSPWRCEENR